MKKTLVLLLSVLAIGAAAQKIELSATTVNFGNIPLKPKSEKSFTVYNRSDKPVVIKTINVDCNCTKIEWKKSPIMAGDSTVVKVVYIPDEIGVFYKKAKILSTGGDREIIIRGTVK